jgi:hypothetical protein
MSGGPPAASSRPLAERLKPAVTAVVAAAATIIVLDTLVGEISVLDGGGPGAVQDRLPHEYLYLDSERVDAYLGQLQGGLASTEKRTESATQRLEAGLGAEGVAQVGATAEQQRTTEQTVSLQAADRYFRLEGLLHDPAFVERFSKLYLEGSYRTFEQGLGSVDEGEFVRLRGAQLQLPTYTLALEKVAHAKQFLSEQQQNRERAVSRRELSSLAIRAPRQLRRFVRSFGANPRLPFRLELVPDEPDAEAFAIFLPVRYSDLVNAPSLLTGRITVVAKVVRVLDEDDVPYYDVESAVTYERALRNTTRQVRSTLALGSNIRRAVVDESATVGYPGLVLLPVAMYK